MLEYKIKWYMLEYKIAVIIWFENTKLTEICKYANYSAWKYANYSAWKTQMI